MRGFSLANTIILSTFILIIALFGLMVTNFNFSSTRAEARYQLAEKAANAGFVQAANLIQRTGFCDISQTITGDVGDATYRVEIKRSGRVCFIRSVGEADGARVVKTGIVQAYYGVGLYTVRGNVDAELGAGVRLSGCDYNADPVCVVPAFIASGNVTSTLPPQRCCQNDDAGLAGCAYTDNCVPADDGGSGLYGNPAIVTHVQFRDLIPLFFNVNCFNIHSDGCDEGLLQVFEREYGVIFDNEYGIPRAGLDTLDPNVPNDCVIENDNYINFENEYLDCEELVLSNYSNTFVYLYGYNSARPKPTVYILRQHNNDNVIVFVSDNLSAQGFRLLSHFPIFLGSSWSCYDFCRTSNDCDIVYWFTRYIVGRNLANTCFSYSEDGTGFTLENVQIVTTKDIFTDDNGITLRDSTIVIAPDDINDTNNNPDAYHSGYRLRVMRGITLDKSQLFVKHIRFSDYSVVNVWDSLVYMYAYACPNCSRTSDTSSLDACRNNDIDWCGWYGRYITLNIGRDDAGRERPSLLISNNSTVHTSYPMGTVYIWGAFVGQDVTYLSWYGVERQHYRGFLIRNFPPQLTLRIRISDGFTMEFRKSILDKLSDNFWFFRKVNCIRDDISVKTQLIQTRSTTY